MEILQFQTCKNCLTMLALQRKETKHEKTEVFFHQQTLPVTGFIVEIKNSINIIILFIIHL